MKDCSSIIFCDDDSLTLYLSDSNRVVAYVYNQDIDIEAVKKYHNIPDVKLYDLSSAMRLLALGEAIETRHSIYVRTEEGIVTLNKRSCITPLVSSTVRRASEVASICGYMRLLPMQQNRFERVIADMYMTLLSQPDTIILPIFATYDYRNNADDNAERTEVATIRTTADWWDDACRELRHHLPEHTNYQAKYIYSYCAKLILRLL